jgi:hypothetical protein
MLPPSSELKCEISTEKVLFCLFSKEKYMTHWYTKYLNGRSIYQTMHGRDILPAFYTHFNIKDYHEVRCNCNTVTSDFSNSP